MSVSEENFSISPESQLHRFFFHYSFVKSSGVLQFSISNCFSGLFYDLVCRTTFIISSAHFKYSRVVPPIFITCVSCLCIYNIIILFICQYIFFIFYLIYLINKKSQSHQLRDFVFIFYFSIIISYLSMISSKSLLSRLYTNQVITLLPVFAPFTRL